MAIKIPELDEFEKNYETYDNKEEILLSHPALDLKFLKTNRARLDIVKTVKLYNSMLNDGKAKQIHHDNMTIILSVV